jgi:hypothetical protein
MIHEGSISRGAIEFAFEEPWQDLIICLEVGIVWD